MGSGRGEGGIVDIVVALSAGGMSIRSIADELTDAGFHGRASKFHATQVARILRRASTPRDESRAAG